MFSGYKDATSCYTDQSVFDNRNQASFLPGDAAKQTSGPPWDYSQQSYSAVPCYAGDQNMSHRHPTAIHNPQVVSQFENNNVVAHYKSINTGNNSHQSVVRPRAVINCQSSCNACYSHSVARVPHSWNPPPAESIRYISGSSSAALSGDEISRVAPNLASFSQHEDCSHHFSGGFASQLTKLSKFSKDHPASILSTVAPKNDILSSTEDSNVLRTQHRPSRVEPMPEKYIPPLQSESAPVKKDSCFTCQGVCTRPNCKSYHQQTIKFPNLEPIPIQQYGVPRENVVRFSGQAASTLNSGNSSCNQWHQSPGLWLQNGHPPGFWMPPSEDIHSMGNAGITNFWSDRNSCEISGQQVPLPQNYHDGASNKPTCQGRSQASLHQQKGGGTVHEGERNNRLHQSMVPRYQKVAEVPQRYSEMPLRQKGLEEIAVSQTCQELLPRRSQQLEAVVECGIQYRQDVVSRHQTPVAKSQMETQSRKDDRGHCEPPSTITSELCHQDLTRSHINSSGISSGSALSDFPPTSVEMHTDQMHQDISRKFQAANFASYLPHDTKVSNSSSSDYSAVLGIAQPPSRFSSNLTYTQSKISRSNNYRRLFSQSCPEDSYNPSHSGDIVRNGFVSNRTTMANTLETSGTSHRHISYRNKEISNTGVKCSVQIGSPSANSLPTDSIIRYGNMKDSSEAPTINTTSASVAVPQISPHLQSCGRMSSESDPPYHSGSTTMQVVEINPACSLGSSAGLSVDPKLLNSLSYISSPRNRQDSMVARSQHVPYQNVLAGTRSEDVPACNMFCGSNSSVLHPGLFDEFGKNYSNTHVSGTKASMISRSFKENFHVTPTNIYTQGNMSASASGLKQQMLPQMEDTGASRPIKKRKPRTKSMVKPDCAQLVGKNLHEEHSSQQPVLDVRQFLATWDEETDILSPAPKLPDVLNSSSTENPLLVLDCRHLNTNGMATLSAVDRSSLSNGQQAENFIPMYQQQLASPSESSSTNNDATKSNTQTLQENSNDVMAQQLGECPSLIPIDPDRMEKFGPSNNCRTSSPEHSVLKQNKPSHFQIQETELSTPNVRSESSVSKSDTVESLVETTGTSIINNIQSSPVNVSTESTVSDSVSLHECHMPAQSLPSQLSHFTEDCDSIHENEKTSSIESHHSFVVQDKSRLRGDSCQHVQQKSRSQSKDCDCSSPPQELPLSCCEIHHAIPINTQEKKRADCHHNQEAGNKESRSVACNNKRAVHTLKALCMYVIECSTNAHQTFDRGICSHRKKSVRRSNDGEIQDLEAELCCSLSEYKEIEKTCAENGSSVLESTNITDRSCISENNSTKDELTSVSESTRTSCLSDEINDTESKISSNKTSDNKKVLCQQTENISGAQEGMKHALTCGVLVNERAASEANTCTTKISNNLTRTVVTKNTVNIPALTGDMLLETSVTSMDRPVSPNERAEELSKIHLPHSNTEQDLETSVTEKSPAVTDQREIQLSGEDMKSCSVEPVEPSISGRELHDVSVSVTSNSEKSHVNLLSYSSDIGEDLDMSVTSSTPATPVILEEVNEESSTEELVAMYEGSVLSDTESEMRLQPDNCISFSSLPCISKMSIREDAQSDHASRIFESLNGSHTVPGTVDDSFPHLVEENFNPEILSDNKKMARTYGLKMSGKGDTEKCELMSSSEMKSLGSNKEPLPFSENSFVGLHSSGEGAQKQSVKSPACQLLDVNHETAAVIQDDSAASVVPSQTVLNIAIPDSKTSECDVQLHSGPQTKDFTEFVPALCNSTLETSNILCGQEPTTHVSTDISSYADSGTKDDCPLFSEPTANGKCISCTSLLCDTPAIIEVNNRQKENGTSIDDTPSHVPSDTSTLLCEELDLRLAENKMDVLSTKQIQLNANKKNPSVSTFPSFNGGHSPVRSEERKRQQEESSVLNDNSVVLTSSSPDNLISGTSKLAVSGDLEDTLKINDRFHCSEVSVCGHPDIPFHYSSRQLVTEEIGNDVSEGLPLQGGGTDSERPKLLRNYVAVSKSVSETTVSCPENMTGSVKVVESSHCYGESVEVIQLHQHDPGVKDKLNAVAVCDKNAGCPSVPQDYNGSSGSDVTVRNEYVSKTNENDIKEFVSHKEDDTDWYTQLKPAISHNDNKSVVPHVSESQDIPPVSSFQQQEFCDLHVENKLPIPVDEDKNEENYKMNSSKSNVTAEPGDPSSLFVANAELAPVQNDILMPNSQQTTVLKSSAKLDQKSDELLSEVDHPVVDCELKSPVTKIPWEDTVVADCEALCSHEPINLSKGTSLKWKDDSTIEENLIAGNNRSFEDTRAQSAGHLCRNFCNDISLNEQKNTANRRVADSDYTEGDSTPDNDGNIVCKRQDVVRKLPSASDYDVADNAISVSMIVAPVNCDKLDVKNTAISVAVSGDNDEKYDTDACIEGAAVTASATAAAAGEYDGGGDNTCAFTTTDAKESDSARNVDQYPCKVQNNLTCADVIRSVTDPDTVADNIVTITTITAATDTADSSAVATTTTNTTTTTTTTMTMSTYVTAAPSTTSITDDVSAGNNMNIADAGEISDDTAAVIAATSTIATVIAATTTVANNAATGTTTVGTTTATTTTTAATTTATTTTTTTTTTNDISAGATSRTVITTTFAAVTTANTATSNDYGDISGCDKGSAVTNPLISYGTEEGLQHEASFQCRNTNLANSMSQEIEWNGMDKEQRYSISMVTSGCLTSEEKNTVKMPVGNDTIENMEYCQPENEVKTTLNLKLVENSKSSTEYIHNQSQKYMTVCETSTSVANVSHVSDHTEYGDTKRQSDNSDTVESMSQQQDGPNQEQISDFEMDTTLAHVQPLQLQCKSAAEPTKDELNNYTRKLFDESSALSVWEDCLSEEEIHNKINNCALVMSHDIHVHQEKHCCLEEPIKNEIFNSDGNIPAETPVHPEWKSADRIIKDEVNCEMNIASDNTSLSEEYHSPLYLNKEEIVDFKINTPENFPSTLSVEQDSSESLGITTVLQVSAGLSPVDEHPSLQEDDDVMSDSVQISLISESSEMIHNNISCLASTRKNVELIQPNMNGQNSPDRQDVDLSVDTDDMPHLEVIDTEVSPHSSDSLEMPCLELVTDPVQPMAIDQVQYAEDMCATAGDLQPVHTLPENMEKNVQEDITEPDMGVVRASQENDTLILEVTVSSLHSVPQSEGNVLPQDQVTNSVNSELTKKLISLVSTVHRSSVSLVRENSTEDSVIQNDSPEEDNVLFASHNSEIFQDNQDRYLSVETPVAEECDCSLEKAVECDIQEVPVTPSPLQVLSTYMDSDAPSAKVVEVNPEYVQVLESDVPHEWESLHLVTSDVECDQSSEKSQEHTADVTVGEMLALADVEKPWQSCNLENETLIPSVGLDVSGTESISSIEAGSMCSAVKETEALISERSENVNLAAAALQDTSDEPTSMVYTEMLPVLDPSLGDVLPVDSVSNWPYLEEEVFSEFPSAAMDSNNSLSVGPSLTVVQSIPNSNCEDTAEFEESLSSDSGSRYNFRTQSCSNDTAVALNGLKCRLSWKKIFALSRADKRNNMKKQESKHGENLEVIYENSKFFAKSKQELKEYTEICHTNGSTELVDKCERLNGNLNTQLQLRNKGIAGLELGPAKIEVRLGPTPSPKGHPKTWRVVDDPKAERIVNWRKSNNILLNASAGNSGCRNVVRDVDLLPSEVTQTPIVLVKRLILKRRCDDDSDADSDIKSKHPDIDNSVDPIVSLDNDNFMQVTAPSKHVDESCDPVTSCGKRLEDSEHINCSLEEYDVSNSSLTASNSNTDTQADIMTDGGSSESEEDRSRTSVESSSQKAGRKLKVFKCDDSNAITLPIVSVEDGMNLSPDTSKRSDVCVDVSNLVDVSINSDIGFSELDATNSCLANEDTTKQQLPKVIIKRTVGMGNTNKYQSFLRGVSSSSDSSSRWQPVVRLERNLSLDKLAKSGTVNNRIFEIADVPDILEHGHKSPPGQPPTMLESLPQLAYSSGDRNRNHSMGTRKRKNGTFLCRTDTQQGDLNDGQNSQKYARKLTTFRSSFWFRQDTCSTSLPKHTKQPSNANSYLSQRSPPLKLKFFSSCNKVQKTERKKAFTCDGGDEYVVVENRNYTKDNMTKITFQRHKRKEVSTIKECKNVKMKEFLNVREIPAILDQLNHAEMQAANDVSATCSEDSCNAFNLTACTKRSSTEVDRHSSKRYFHNSHKKHMSDVSHCIISSKQNVSTVLKDAGDVVSEVCSKSEVTLPNDKPSAVSQPRTIQSARTTNDYCPKTNNSKKRRYYEDMYFEKDVLPLFQPERILSISSTKKKRTIVKEQSPQFDGKTLEEEIINLSTESHMDYGEIVPQQQTRETDVEVKEGQNCSSDESLRRLPDLEACPVERMSNKNSGLIVVTSSQEPQPELQTLGDLGPEYVSSSSAMKAGEQQNLRNDNEPDVVESTMQEHDACQACGHVYGSHDERTTHIRRHPYHCQRCHLAFRSEVDFMSHLAEQHPRTRERHHCLLCERSFPTAERYKQHLSGRTHRHLELTQRRTIHTLFSVFTGHNCPVLTPLSESELAGLKWFPVEPGTIHFYHQATPLQRAVQDLLLRKEGNYTNITTKSNVRTQEDHPSKSSDTL